MRIDNISAKSFVAYDHLNLDLSEAQIAVFVGPHGGGKTTITDILRTVLTGTSRGYNKLQARNLIRGEAKGLKVAADLRKGQGRVRFLRTTTTLKAGPIRGGEEFVPETFSQAKMDQAIGVDRRVLESALDAGKAIDLKPVDRRALALELFKVRVSIEALQEAKVDDEEVAALALDGDWKKAEKKAHDLRMKVQRDANRLDVPSPEDPVVRFGKNELPASQAPEESVQKVEAVLGTKKDERDSLLRAVGERKGRGAANVDLTQERLDRAVKARGDADLEEKKKELEELEASNEADGKALGALRTKAQKAREKKNEEMTVEQELKKHLAQSTKAGEEHDCQICGLTHKGEVPKGMVEQTKKDIKACAGRLQKAEEKLRALITEGSEKNGLLETAKAKYQALEESYRELERRQTQVLQLKADLAEAIVGQEDPEITKKREQLTALTANIATVEANIQHVKQYRAAKTLWDQGQAKLKGLREEVVALAVQEDACKPSGLPRTLFEEVRVQVETEMNWWASENLLPWEIRIDSEFEIHTPHGPLFTATPSERFRVGLALGATLSVASGLKFLVVDELERLTVDRQRQVLGCLVQLLVKLDQVLVTMAHHKKPAKGFAGPIRTFWVAGNGTVELVEGD